MTTWLAIAAPEHVGSPRPEWEEPLTESDLQDAADSYLPDYREASFVCAYDPATGANGPPHVVSRWLPEVSRVSAIRWNAELQVLEAETEITERFRQLVDMGFRKPSVGLMKFKDHPSGEVRWYVQHVELVPAGSVEVIPGLAKFWPERLRSVQVPGEEVRRAVYGGEIELPKEKPMAKEKEKAQPDPEEQVTPPETEESNKAEEVEEPKAEESKPDPLAEVTAQLEATNNMVRSLAATVETLTKSQNDPEEINKAISEVEKLRAEMAEEVATERERRFRSAVEELAQGSSPRLRVAEVDSEVEVLLALDSERAKARLEILRAKPPIATSLDEDLAPVIELAEKRVDIERYRSNDGSLPCAEEIRELSGLVEKDTRPARAMLRREAVRRYQRGA